VTWKTIPAWARFVLCGASAALLGACGDDMHRLGGPGRGSSEGGVFGLCREHAELELIDNMEDGFDSILKEEDRSGFWFAFNDGTGGQQIPPPNAPLYPMQRLEPPREESWYAIRTHGSDFTGWGAGIGFDLRSHDPYDASGYAGIAFWARAEPGNTTSLRVSITDRNTAPQGLRCVDTEDTSVTNRCYDNFGADLTLTENWQAYSYSWSKLDQEGFSGQDYPAIVRTHLYGVRFQVDPGPFDFSIDDVSFLCPGNE
jgi:hypothetical protein